jgi:phosphoenolpyruvate carboxykinase (ATP)
MYYFLSGYTAKLAGTEVGLGKEPEATFSTCFASPFLPLHPSLYAKMLKEKIEKYSVNVWLVNTGWVAGPYGVGSRIKLPITRALIKAALSDQIQEDEFVKEPTFGLNIPIRCKDVPDEILNPMNTWEDKESYTQISNELKIKFEQNYETFSRKLEQV